MLKVLRLGHRRGRDDRISTHVGLTARQWGADEVVYSGEKDESMMDSLNDIIERWGGEMKVNYEEDFQSAIDQFEGLKVHLTMYGESIEDMEKNLESKIEKEDLLVIVGAEKVPRSVYEKVDYNLGVGHQPHSEIAALAVFLDRYTGIKKKYEGAEIEVVPSQKSKKTRELEREN